MFLLKRTICSFKDDFYNDNTYIFKGLFAFKTPEKPQCLIVSMEFSFIDPNKSGLKSIPDGDERKS